jgi:hypothetical protein
LNVIVIAPELLLALLEPLRPPEAGLVRGGTDEKQH